MRSGQGKESYIWDHQILEKNWGVSSINGSGLNSLEPQHRIEIKSNSSNIGQTEAYHAASTEKLLLNNPLLFWKLFFFSMKPFLWAPRLPCLLSFWCACHQAASQLSVILMVWKFWWDVSQIFQAVEGCNQVLHKYLSKGWLTISGKGVSHISQGWHWCVIRCCNRLRDGW